MLIHFCGINKTVSSKLSLKCVVLILIGLVLLVFTFSQWTDEEFIEDAIDAPVITISPENSIFSLISRYQVLKLTLYVILSNSLFIERQVQFTTQ